MPRDDFKNFLIIQKMENDKKERTFLSFLKHKKYIILFIILIIIFFIFLYNIFFTKINLNNLKDKNTFFQINNGESVASIGDRLLSGGVIKSKFAFKIYTKIFYQDTTMQAGIYNLEKDDTLISLANKIMKGKYAVPPIKITIPEGSTNQEIANIISKSFLNIVNLNELTDDFSEKNILNKIYGKQGYLFPETYIFLPNTNLDKVVNNLSNEFYKNLKYIFTNNKEELGIYSLDLKIFDIDSFFDDQNKNINLTKRFTIISQIGTTTVSIKDIIIMASFLEGEANNEEDMRKVSGVLWNRLKLNYPLQIDAATSTYKEKGFTDSPIDNPGILAIKAAINPINTNDIYYITGNDGIMHYAKDYKTHLDNINKYLRNNR